MSDIVVLQVGTLDSENTIVEWNATELTWQYHNHDLYIYIHIYMYVCIYIYRLLPRNSNLQSQRQKMMINTWIFWPDQSSNKVMQLMNMAKVNPGFRKTLALDARLMDRYNGDDKR